MPALIHNSLHNNRLLLGAQPGQGRGRPQHAKLSEPQSRVPSSASSRSLGQPCLRQAARLLWEPGLLQIPTPLSGSPAKPPKTPPDTYFPLHLPELHCLHRPLAAASRSARAQKLTLASPRPRSFPAPGKSGTGAWSGTRGYSGGARSRAPGPRSRCGQAPPPLRGPGYSPQ